MKSIKLRDPFRDLTRFERGLWLVSLALVSALTLLRSPYYALAYAANDWVLLCAHEDILWLGIAFLLLTFTQNNI